MPAGVNTPPSLLWVTTKPCFCPSSSSVLCTRLGWPSLLMMTGCSWLDDLVKNSSRFGLALLWASAAGAASSRAITAIAQGLVMRPRMPVTAVKNNPARAGGAGM